MPIEKILKLRLNEGGEIEVYKSQKSPQGADRIGLAYVKGSAEFEFELGLDEVSDLLRLLRGISRSVKLSGKKRGPRRSAGEAPTVSTD